MGALAEGLVAYVQPLIDGTDGSMEQLNQAMMLGQMCYNFALLPADLREGELRTTQESLQMDDEEFKIFQQDILGPMVQRHHEMFPQLHRRNDRDHALTGPSWNPSASTAVSQKKLPGTEPYEPCPCQSGKKYKFCCGSKRR